MACVRSSLELLFVAFASRACHAIQVYFANGDRATGQKVVVMENLQDHVPAGVFFGPGNPNNWGLVDKVRARRAASTVPR